MAVKNEVKCWKSWADERASFQLKLNLLDEWDQAYPDNPDAMQEVWARLHGEEFAPKEHAILSICPSAGGTEAVFWAEELTRTFLRYAEHHGCTAEIMDQNEGTYVVRVEGKDSALLESQKGVHRFVRQSPYDKNKKVHTSFVEVGVSYDMPEDDLNFHKKDVRVDVMRSSGAGGQHVNKTESAVRLTHVPTGIVALCRKGRSQHTNKKTAWSVLLKRLAEHAHRQSPEHKQIAGWGEKTFTYHAGRDVVIHHPTGRTQHGMKSYMQGRGLLMGIETALPSHTNKQQEPE